MNDVECRDHLRHRLDYLILRVAAKERAGYESPYEKSERDALTWALNSIDNAARLKQIRASYARTLQEFS